MKKLITLAIALSLLLFGAQSVAAYTYPSTNELNKTQQVPGRIGQLAPYVETVETGVGYVKLRFVNGYVGLHYFEYRVDGVVLTSGEPHYFLNVLKGDTTEFEYPGVCVQTTGAVCPTGPIEMTINANEKVEVRLALGAEDDWYFDWTEFKVDQPVVPLNKDECKKDGWKSFSNPTFKNQGECVSYVATRFQSFAAGDSQYYNGPTDASPLYGTGAVGFTWEKKTGKIVSGYYDEVVGGVTYRNVVTDGAIVGDNVSLTFKRTDPNTYGPFYFTGTLTGNVLTGNLDGPYLFTAFGK